MTRRRTGQIARFGLCLIIAGMAIYGLLGLVSVAEANGALIQGNHEPVASGSTRPYNGGLVQFVIIDSDTVDSMVPYIGGTIPVLVAGLFLVYRKYAGDNDHGVIMVQN